MELDDDGNSVAQWTKATAPKTVKPNVYLDAWRGGLRAWRMKRTGLLRNSHTGLFLHEALAEGGPKATPLPVDEVVSAMCEDARHHGLDFDAARTKRALLQVARETNQRLTTETFALPKAKGRKP